METVKDRKLICALETAVRQLGCLTILQLMPLPFCWRRKEKWNALFHRGKAHVSIVFFVFDLVDTLYALCTLSGRSWEETWADI